MDKTLKKILTFAVALLFWSGFMLLLFAFVAWEFSPNKWQESTRFLYVVFGPVIGLILSATSVVATD